MRYGFALFTVLAIAASAMAGFNDDLCLSAPERAQLESELQEVMTDSDGSITSCYILEQPGKALYVLVFHAEGIATIFAVLGFNDQGESFAIPIMDLPHDQARRIIAEHEKTLPQHGKRKEKL